MHGYKATDVAWEADAKTMAERMVLLAIAKFAGEGLKGFPSVALIAKVACMNEKTAYAALRGLESRGVIRVTRGGKNNSNTYELLDGSTENGSTENGTPKNGTTEFGSSGTPKNGSSGTPKIGCLTNQLTNQLTEAPENVFSSAPASEEKPTPPKSDGKSKKQRSSKKKEDEEPPIDCPDGINVHYFNAVNAARRKKRVPVYTQTTWGLHCKAAEKCGLSPNDALEIAAEAGWAGFRACYYKPDQRKTSGPASDPTQDIFK